jgi:hypothetical protein
MRASGDWAQVWVRRDHHLIERCAMPAKTEKQRKFMGAELQRKREGKKTRTGMSENELEKMASKGGKKKDKD